MSTRATIQFKDEYDTFFVYRHCDGYPEQIMPDIEKVIENAHGRWSGSECGMFVAFFLGSYFDPKARLSEYMMTSYWHGDESYQYYVEWDTEQKEWKARISGEIIDPDHIPDHRDKKTTSDEEIRQLTNEVSDLRSAAEFYRDKLKLIHSTAASAIQ
jgi:hypothetical protein